MPKSKSKIVATVTLIAEHIREQFKDGSVPESEAALINNTLASLPNTTRERYGDAALIEGIKYINHAMATLSGGKNKMRAVEVKEAEQGA